jgi:hypothetical protein
LLWASRGVKGESLPHLAPLTICHALLFTIAEVDGGPHVRVAEKGGESRSSLGVSPSIMGAAFQSLAYSLAIVLCAVSDIIYDVASYASFRRIRLAADDLVLTE